MLSADERRTFAAHGVVVVRGMFTDDEVARARAAFERLWQRAQGMRGVTSEVVDDALFVLKERPDDVVVQRVVWAGGAEPDLLELGRDPRLVETALALLGTTSCAHLLNQAHFKMPGDGVSFDWHQDIQHRDKGGDTWRDVTGDGSFVQSILLLDPMTPDNGPLQFLPDDAVVLDERGRLSLPHDDYSAPPIHPGVAGATLLPTASSTVDDQPAFDRTKAVTIEGAPGDVLFFGPWSVHGSLPNRSTTPRRVLINGYAAPGANGRVYPGAGLGQPLPGPTRQA